jgi:hypothetical protein
METVKHSPCHRLFLIRDDGGSLVGGVDSYARRYVRSQPRGYHDHWD